MADLARRPRVQSPLRRRRGMDAQRLQVLFALAGLALGLLVPKIPGGPRAPSAQVIDMLFALGFGILGVTGVIFSVLFLVVQWAHASFSPRLLLFRRSPVVWRTFAVAVAVAVFSITAALAIGRQEQVSVAVPAVAGILLLVMLLLLRTLLLTALAAVQLAPVLRSIAGAGHSVLASFYRSADQQRPQDGARLPPVHGQIVWPGHTAVLQQVDIDRMVQLAQHAGATVVLSVVPGAVLARGTVVARLHGGRIPDADVLSALVTGGEETFEQDPFLAFRLLADIALRALSPAVNDPATAVQTLDQLEDLLGAIPAGPVGSVQAVGADGVVCVMVGLPGRDVFLRLGLDEVIAAAVNSPTVLLRVRTLCTRLSVADRVRDPVVAGRQAWVERELAERYPLVWSEANGGRPGRAREV
ncbi:DUF2254 domain-containing protein [Actinospica durhamensis]|uniref:DUF2254 domain-containing protein n=1 Tax=Actinospica durhamensis TaxID=1508375 RepID=A0A941ENQ4_9ACTN|nr:DUF2254 family protein [Actinospica durhamensis]MBR7834445.1 DUF2254 domain-containing protein [Actinospica durhamensis]